MIRQMFTTLALGVALGVVLGGCGDGDPFDGETPRLDGRSASALGASIERMERGREEDDVDALHEAVVTIVRREAGQEAINEGDEAALQRARDLLHGLTYEEVLELAAERQ